MQLTGVRPRCHIHDRGALTTDLGGRAVSRSLVYSRSSFSFSTRRRSVKERSRAALRDMVVGV
jgi:hypothetical protein